VLEPPFVPYQRIEKLRQVANAIPDTNGFQKQSGKETWAQAIYSQRDLLMLYVSASAALILHLLRISSISIALVRLRFASINSRV